MTDAEIACRPDIIEHRGQLCILTLYRSGKARLAPPLFDSRNAAQQMVDEIMAIEALWRLLCRRGIRAIFPFPVRGHARPG